MRGRNVRFVTLLVPLPYCNARVDVSGVVVSATAVRFEVAVDGHREQVRISRRGVTIRVRPRDDMAARDATARRGFGNRDTSTSAIEAPCDKT